MFFKGNLTSIKSFDNDTIPEDLFQMSVISNRDKYDLATVRVTQIYPIKCTNKSEMVDWKHLGPEEKTLDETCSIILHPRIFHAHNGQSLNDFQISKCPIEIPDAARCSSNRSSTISHICNVVEFNVTLCENAKRKLKLDHHARNPIIHPQTQANYTKVLYSLRFILRNVYLFNNYIVQNCCIL